VFDTSSGTLELGRLDTARAHDIADKGLFVSGIFADPGMRLHFFFELPETSGGCIEAFGVVVHTRRSGVGVRFSHLSRRDRLRLDRYLAERKAIEHAYLSAARVRARAEQVRVHPN
jgi:hypothetical protein